MWQRCKPARSFSWLRAPGAPVNPRPNERRALAELLHEAERWSAVASRYVLTVSIATQTVALFRRAINQCGRGRFARYQFVRRYVCSTSRFGIGSVSGSNCTPLGLHRIAEKIGGGMPIGTVFKGRKPVGLTWQGMSDASIVHRILWLDGLEPGFNRGGNMDTHARYIYIHGFGDELTLGRPMSHGCIHLAAADLLPLFEKVASGTLVWIG